jgi:hypothetical protein
MPKVRLLGTGFGSVAMAAFLAVGLLLAAARGLAAEKTKAADGGEKPKPAAGAEQYDTIEYQVEQKRKFAVIGKMFSDQQFPPEGEQLLTDYFRHLALADWLLPEKRTEMPQGRAKLVKELKAKGMKPGPVYVYFRDKVVLPAMEEVARPKGIKLGFHPVARVNAMLIIGELNEKETASAATIPVPLSIAVPVMVAAVDDPDQIDGVRVAAMAGLLRHARLGGINTPEAKKLVSASMFRLLKTVKVPAGRTPEGHAWMRGQAAELLGEIGSTSEIKNAGVVDALAAAVTDGSLIFSARCTAARALGKLKYAADSKLNATPWAAALGRMAIDACTAEMPPTTFSQPRITERIAAVSAGLRGSGEQAKGLAPLMTSADQKKLLAELVKAVDALDKAARDKDVPAIGEIRLTLEELLKTDK